jgi:hypothetical protein
MSAFGCPHCEGYAVTQEPEGVYYLDGDQLRVLNAISDALHSGSDAMRDLGHKLWLVLNQVKGN